MGELLLHPVLVPVVLVENWRTGEALFNRGCRDECGRCANRPQQLSGGLIFSITASRPMNWPSASPATGMPPPPLQITVPRSLTRDAITPSSSTYIGSRDGTTRQRGFTRLPFFPHLDDPIRRAAVPALVPVAARVADDPRPPNSIVEEGVGKAVDPELGLELLDGAGEVRDEGWRYGIVPEHRVHRGRVRCMVGGDGGGPGEGLGEPGLEPGEMLAVQCPGMLRHEATPVHVDQSVIEHSAARNIEEAPVAIRVVRRIIEVEVAPERRAEDPDAVHDEHVVIEQGYSGCLRSRPRFALCHCD